MEKKIALTLMDQGSCVKGNGETTMNNGDGQIHCRYVRAKHVTTTSYDCHHREGRVIKAHKGDFRSDLATMTGCRYDSEYCYTANGIHIRWAMAREEQQEFKFIGQFNATKVDDKILIVELGMTLLVRGEKDAMIFHDRNFKIEVIRKSLEPEKKEFAPPTVQGSEEEVISMLREEFASKIQFLLDMLQSGRTKAKILCDVYNYIAQQEIMLAVNDATTYIRYKTGNQLLIAKSLGEKVLAFPCIPVKTYRWINNSSQCFEGIPIKFTLPNTKEEYTGYLQTPHNYINTKAIKVNCSNKGPTYTSVKEEILLHTKGEPLTVNLTKTEQLTYGLNKGVGMINFLDTAWASDASDTVHIDVQQQVLQELHEQAATWDAEETPDIPHGWKFLGLLNGHPLHVFDIIVTWVFRGIVVWLVYMTVGMSCMKSMRQWRSKREVYEMMNTMPRE